VKNLLFRLLALGDVDRHTHEEVRPLDPVLLKAASGGEPATCSIGERDALFNAGCLSQRLGLLHTGEPPRDPRDLTGNDGHPGEDVAFLTHQEVNGGRIDGDDGADLCADEFTAQAVGHCMDMAGTAEPGIIQVLGVQLHIEPLACSKCRTDSLIGPIVSRVRLALAVENQDPFGLLGLGGNQWLRQR
jgi:hypothetical protein